MLAARNRPKACLRRRSGGDNRLSKIGQEPSFTPPRLSDMLPAGFTEGDAKMNWDALGAIGELVGAAAVVLTLGYLAFQIRQSSALARAAAQREINNSFQSALAHMRDHLKLYQRGSVDFDSLSHEEQIRFEFTLAPILNHLDQVIRMYQQGLETKDNLDAYGTYCLAMLQAPGTRSWWERIKPYFVKETRDYLEKRLADPGSLPTAFIDALPWHSPDAD
ncbi:MAG: hypothetical protein ACI9BW_002580 [Gammaproteobacteria bacterium]|jgi:hypothetical protein